MLQDMPQRRNWSTAPHSSSTVISARSGPISSTSCRGMRLLTTGRTTWSSGGPAVPTS